MMLHNMDSSSNIIKVTKSRAKKFTGYVARRGKVINIHIKLEDLGVDERMK
jgi:hypothetical protein